MISTPAFIITIDTEGDNIWQNYRNITTKNASFLPRFQTLCEKYRFKPVYLANYEMAIDKVFIDFARDVISRGSAEVGMHLHAWNSPPIWSLTGNDWYYKPYLTEYSEPIMREKIIFLTQLLEDTFQTKMLSHRAGRWSFNELYANILLELGYRIDCSVTPKINWHRSLGMPSGAGGSNYKHFPDCAYFIDLEDISRPGTSQLLEVPITTSYKHSSLVNAINQVYNRLRSKRRDSSVLWLRPTGDNVTQMYQMAAHKINIGTDYLEFMLHSSELMPGGSPTFNDKAAIDRLYCDLDLLFNRLQHKVISMTLSQYYQYRLEQKILA